MTRADGIESVYSCIRNQRHHDISSIIKTSIIVF